MNKKSPVAVTTGLTTHKPIEGVHVMNDQNLTHTDNSDQEFLTITDIQLDEMATRAAIYLKEIEALKSENKSWERLFYDFCSINKLIWGNQ